MKNLLAIFLILNGACLGKVKKRRRAVTKAQYEALRVSVKEDLDGNLSVKRKPGVAVKKELVNRDAVCKTVTRNYTGSKGSAGRANTRADKLTVKIKAISSKVVQETLITAAKDSTATRKPLRLSHSVVNQSNSGSSATVTLIKNASVTIAKVNEHVKGPATLGAGSFRLSQKTPSSLESLLSLSLVSDLNTVYTIVTDTTPGYDNEYNAVFGAQDGSVFCAGYCDGQDLPKICVAKYTSEFILDRSFGSGGIVITDLSLLDANVKSSVANAILVDSDNNVYIAGYVTFNDLSKAIMLAKYDNAGNPVDDFGFHGAVVYAVDSPDSEVKSLAFEPLNNPLVDEPNFDLVIAGTVLKDGFTQGLVGKIDPITGDFITFGGGDFLAIFINPSDESPITVFNGVSVAAITNMPGTDFTDYIYLAGYAPYHGTNYMLVIQLDTYGNFVYNFDQNGAVLLDISNTDAEAIATSVDVSRGGPVVSGYWVDKSGNRKYAQAAFTYLGVLYAYSNSFSSDGSSTDIQSNGIVALTNGQVIAFANITQDLTREPVVSVSTGFSQTPNSFPENFTMLFSTSGPCYGNGCLTFSVK